LRLVNKENTFIEKKISKKQAEIIKKYKITYEKSSLKIKLYSSYVF